MDGGKTVDAAGRTADGGEMADGGRMDSGRPTSGGRTADGGRMDGGWLTYGGRTAGGRRNRVRHFSMFCPTSISEHRSYINVYMYIYI